ncbi:response regulator [Devosia sp. A16]|uniref:response regulator n=1 Tax=Devosia sp. A16 TaxID=1736675 RepID=UPI0006D7AA32|nr:response regulator transcription factor [Devosia sp. A16]
MDQTRLLVIEDDPDISALLAEFLSREGYEVRTLQTGRLATQTVAGFSPALVILDIMLPGEDGFSVCRRIRSESAVPIIMLTARSDDVDKIVGLELGADDYLGKPFNPRELLARIRARLRRSLIHDRPSARRRAVGELIIDLDGRAISTRSGTVVGLTTAEYDLLACFIEHPRRVLSRDQLLDWTRGRTADPLDRTIDVTVSRLRARLAPVAPSVVQAITTVRNGGYLFAMPVEDA